jgi:c-di-GMP-binding flagellar brake protein YcgR
MNEAEYSPTSAILALSPRREGVTRNTPDRQALTMKAPTDVPSRLLDLSLGGARVAQPAPLPIGSVGEFALELGGEILRVRAEVRHCSPAEDGRGYQAGIRFVGVEPQDERKLRDYVASRTARRRRGRA